MKFSVNFFLKKKPTNKYNLMYVQRRPIQSDLSMYAFSVNFFYLLSCEDIKLEVHTHLLMISKKISITQKCNNF